MIVRAVIIILKTCTMYVFLILCILPSIDFLLPSTSSTVVWKDVPTITSPNSEEYPSFTIHGCYFFFIHYNATIQYTIYVGDVDHQHHDVVAVVVTLSMCNSCSFDSSSNSSSNTKNGCTSAEIRVFLLFSPNGCASNEILVFRF
jgi:hypothetical protein